MRLFATAAALTMLGFGTVLAAEDHTTIKVLRTEVIEIPSGPGDTSAILSPDGSRVLSIGMQEVCLLAPAQMGPWAELACVEKDRENRIRGPWDMRWSPDGDQLLMPTYADAFVTFRDTDITLYDPQSFTRTVVTDDGVSGSVMTGSETVLFDVAARWLDADTIAFMRYEIPPGGLAGRRGPWLMTVDIDAGEPQHASKIVNPGAAIVYALAISRDGTQYAYPLDDRDAPKIAGIYVAPIGGSPRRVVALTEISKSPSGLEFSADGKFLMVMGPSEDFSESLGHIIDLDTGVVSPIASGQPLVGAAWSPTGSAVAYLTYDRTTPDSPGGLFLSPSPGAPGRLLIGGSFYASTCCGYEPFVWASNDTMLLGRADDASMSMLYVQLGQ
jgi:hypothetical protein